MKQQKLINHKIQTAIKLGTAALITAQVSMANASYWDESIGFYSAPNKLTPGQSMNLSTKVCAQRNSDANVPVYFYHSTDNKYDSYDKALGSATGFIPETGSFCSSIINKTVYAPTTTQGSCFSPFSGYILFKAGSDVKASVYTPEGGNTLPTVTGFEPQSGHVGSIVRISGDNFDPASTAVFIGNVEAARGFETDANGNTSIFAIIPQGATSNKITLKTVGAGWEYCASTNSQSASNFVVEPAPNYCASGALYTGYGKTSFVQSGAGTYDARNLSACPGYTDNTNLITITEQGESNEPFNIEFGTCGAADYSKLFKLYVDWNNDEDFNDPGEFVVNAPNVAADTLYSLGLSVPATAEVGTSRIRMITALYYTGTIDTADDVQACGNYPFGETQDYSLDISSSQGILTATSSALGLTFNSLGQSKRSTSLINNPKQQDTKAPSNVINQSETGLPPMNFTYPTSRSIDK